MSKTSAFFAERNHHRFWKVLETQLLKGESQDAKELLFAYTEYFLNREQYPPKFGNQLYWLIASIPSEIRRLKIEFPLLPTLRCISLCQFAQDVDSEDVQFLLMAASGKADGLKIANIDFEDSVNSGNTGKEKLQFLISEANRIQSAIAQKLDSARAVYGIDSIVADNSEKAMAAATSFFIHLQRHYGTISEPQNSTFAQAECCELLENAFAREGGLKGALAEARDATRGGLRCVFDLMTAEFNRKEKGKHLNLLLKTVLDPLEREKKLMVVKALLTHLEGHLPPEIISQPPERFIESCEMLVRGLLDSMEHVKGIFRTL